METENENQETAEAGYTQAARALERVARRADETAWEASEKIEEAARLTNEAALGGAEGVSAKERVDSAVAAVHWATFEAVRAADGAANAALYLFEVAREEYKQRVARLAHARLEHVGWCGDSTAEGAVFLGSSCRDDS